MQLDKFAEMMGVLLAAYGKNTDSKRVKVYYEYLKDLPEQALRDAISTAIKSEEYFPNIACLRKYTNTEITIDKVIGELRSIMRIPMGQSFSRISLHPVTAQILGELGGKFSLMQMTDDQLTYKVKRIFNYAVAGIKNERPKIEGHRGGAESMTSLIPRTMGGIE